MSRLRFHVIAAVLFAAAFSSFSPATARIFPNISSIPPWLIPNDTISGAWDAFQGFGGCRFGEKADGLSKLKHYFNHFGYIPSSPAFNFTDDFDDQLESAIKTYQRNFNLNVTGELDGPTLQRLMMPRCGNPDVVNGTSTMNSGAGGAHHNASAHTRFHTVGHFSFFPGTPVWPVGRRDLTYAFLPENELTPEVKAVFVRAFSRWAAVTSLTFSPSEEFVTADIRIGFFVGDHGDGEPFDGVLGTLAHAFSPTSGRFHLDGEENWVIGGDITASTISSAIDLESVAVHEIGHLLGLGHSSVEDSIMFPTITSRTRKVDLHGDDIQGIQTLYGVNPNYVNTPPSPPSSTYTPSPTTHQRETSDGGASERRWKMGLISAVGLGFLVL